MPVRNSSKSNLAQAVSEEEKAEMKIDTLASKSKESSSYDLAMSVSEEPDIEVAELISPGDSSSNNEKKKKKKKSKSSPSSSTLDKKSSHSKHHSSSRQSKSSSHGGSDTYREHDKTKVTFGEYEFVFPKEKFPLLKVMGCAVVLLVSIFIDEGIYSSNYRYGIILAVVAFLSAIIGVVIPSKKAMFLNYFISVVTYAGACLNTIDPGPFVQPGNGYFAAWGLAIYSASAANPPGSLKRIIFHTTLTLGAAALVVLLSLLPILKDGVTGHEQEWEIYVAIGGSALTLVVVGVFLSLKLYNWQARTNLYGESIVHSVLAVMWLGVACIVSYRGPFKLTGNGYFASWFACFTAIKAAWYEWKHNHEGDERDY
mmetsp:Transcript_17577/g.33339  ORF Transcript_17577/g.33339 Transcript_17577/m.33339 type:complete len:370 (-) Transcript_17577:286-1395(-)